MSVLSIEIDPDQHRLIEEQADGEGKTLEEFILSRVLPQKDDRQPLLEAIEAPRQDDLVFESIDDLKDAVGA